MTEENIFPDIQNIDRPEVGRAIAVELSSLRDVRVVRFSQWSAYVAVVMFV